MNATKASSSHMFSVRHETPEDYGAVRRINERAFERSDEADLIEILRRAGRPYVSLVAVEEHGAVGHVFFSRVEIESKNAAIAVMGLGPMAVVPERQRQGVGSALVREGLQACKKVGTQAIVILGHPGYYPRFGFQPAAAYGLFSEYRVPAEAFMAVELSPGALAGLSGTVKYHKAFRQLG